MAMRCTVTGATSTDTRQNFFGDRRLSARLGLTYAAVIATPADGHMAFLRNHIVGRVQVDPAMTGTVDRQPCV